MTNFKIWMFYLLMTNITSRLVSNEINWVIPVKLKMVLFV